MRPIVTLKMATSLDGRIATATGQSKWITGEAARAEGHRLRAAHDAILVGVETVLADDPELTARLLPVDEVDGVDQDWSKVDRRRDREAQGLVQPPPAPPARSQGEPAASAFAAQTGSRQPLRVVLDSRLRTPPSAKVATENTLILTADDPRPIGAAEVVRVGASDGRPAPEAVLPALFERGVRSLLIEGGGHVAASFLRAGLVDRLDWFRAPILLGGEGRPCVAGLALADLASAPKFRRLSVTPVGDDLWERYERI